MTTPTTPGGTSSDQPTYVDPITGSPLYIDPTTGQLSYGPPPTTPPAPTTPITYPGATATPDAASQPSMPGYSGYPAGYPATPGYGFPTQSGTGYTYPLSAYSYGQPQPKTNGMAIASLVTGITSLPFLGCYGVGIVLGLVGAILGHVARRQIKTRGEAGTGMALAGIICGYTAIALGIVGVIFIVYLVSHSDQFTVN